MTLLEFFRNQPLGMRSHVAKQAGIAPAYLYQIEHGIKPAPVLRVIAIARATGWKVTPHELRPEIYPNPTDALPKESTR